MKYGLPLFLLTVFAASLALPQANTTTSKPPTSKSKTPPAATKTAKKSSTSSKNAAPVNTTAARKGKASKKTAVVAAPKYRQLSPTPDRYKEIQQALVDKGYLKSEPSGVWDTQSADALRSFQTDQKLSPTGKISSASLIGLGLGPKTAPATSTVPGPPEVPGTPEN
jgi:Putative peptidoglycan binding domain